MSTLELINTRCAELVEALVLDDGFTVDLDRLDPLANIGGYAVSVYPDAEQMFDFEEVTADTLARYIADQDWAEGDVFGGWIGADGKVFLDRSRVVPTLIEALTLARDHGQLAIFCLATGEEIPVVLHRL